MRLLGSWSLVSWESRSGEERILPGGEHPQGDLLYTPDGRFSAHIANSGRGLLGTVDPRGGTLEAQAAAFATYIAYCGHYEIDGDDVLHHVELSTIQDWVGTVQRRHVELDDDHLVLSTPPMLAMGVTQTSALRWRRRPAGG